MDYSSLPMPEVTAEKLIRLGRIIPLADNEHQEIEQEVFVGEGGLLDQTPVRLVKGHLGALHYQPRMAQEKVYNELAAKYLPVLNDAYRAQDTPANAPMTLMNTTTHTPYFVRFCKLPAAEGLAALLAHRIAVTAFPNDIEPDDIAEVCQFLSTMLVLQGADSVAQSDKDLLVPKLRAWNRQYKGMFAEETTERCMMQLSPRGRLGAEMAFLAPMMKAKLEKGVEVCKMANCSVSAKSIGKELMQCSRCRSVRYCTVAHQRQDWAVHKQICFAPTF